MGDMMRYQNLKIRIVVRNIYTWSAIGVAGYDLRGADEGAEVGLIAPRNYSGITDISYSAK